MNQHSPIQGDARSEHAQITDVKVLTTGLGVHALRRQTAREFPDAHAGDVMRSFTPGTRSDERQPGRPPASIPAGHSDARVAQLERLAQLHGSGSSTDVEFAAERPCSCTVRERAGRFVRELRLESSGRATRVHR